MSRTPLDRDIDQRIKRLESRTGKRVLLRPVRARNPSFRGRVAEKRDHFVLEYRDETAGYFWDHDIVRELLTCIEEGVGRSVTLYDGDVQYVEVPLRHARKGDQPPRKSG
jgi:hypothetical protein